jgi:hypothetical protein
MFDHRELPRRTTSVRVLIHGKDCRTVFRYKATSLSFQYLLAVLQLAYHSERRTSQEKQPGYHTGIRPVAFG